jgi:hypothetical protein
MQAAHRARDGDIQHARRLVGGAIAFQSLQEVIQRRLARAAPAPAIDRRRQQALAGFQRQAVPGQQRRIRRPRAAMQSGQDHGVELETLGLVDGHQLQAAVGPRVGRGEQPRHVVFEAVQRKAPRRVELVQALEEGLRVGCLRPRTEAGRPAQLLPGIFDPAPARLAALPRQRFGHDLAQVGQASPAVGRQARHARRVSHQRPERGLVVVAGQREQVGKPEPAPGCAQDRQPVQAVAAMMQGARERDQVLHRLALGQRLDFDSACNASPPDGDGSPPPAPTRWLRARTSTAICRAGSARHSASITATTRSASSRSPVSPPPSPVTSACTATPASGRSSRVAMKGR